MTYYDQWDIVDAHYWWNAEHHEGQWSPEYERQCRIGQYFKPSPLARGPESHNAIEIYNALCERSNCEWHCLDE